MCSYFAASLLTRSARGPASCYLARSWSACALHKIVADLQGVICTLFGAYQHGEPSPLGQGRSQRVPLVRPFASRRPRACAMCDCIRMPASTQSVQFWARCWWERSHAVHTHLWHSLRRAMKMELCKRLSGNTLASSGFSGGIPETLAGCTNVRLGLRPQRVMRGYNAILLSNAFLEGRRLGFSLPGAGHTTMD